MRTLLLAALLAPAVATAAPFELTHQGRLLDSSGAALTGATDITFSIYANATGGTALWTETQSLDLDGGFFSAQLGSATTLDDTVFDGSIRYIGVQVGSDAELDRQPIVSVPYALHADTATNVDGGTVNATSITVNGSDVLTADAGVSFSDITGLPPGLDDGDTLDTLDCSADQLAVFDGTVWACGSAAGGAHNHSADEVNSGVLDLARIPVASDDTGVAIGNHTHDIGTLTGALKLADVSTCDGPAEGTLRYNSGKVEFCDGTDWAAIGGDSGVTHDGQSGDDKNELYHLAIAVPGAGTVSSSAVGGNRMMFCSPLTDDNEPGPLGFPHASGFQNAYVTGFATDINGHCASGISDWTVSGPCVALTFTNWDAVSHEGFGAWCRRTAANDTGIVWAQYNLEGEQYYNSAGTISAGLVKPDAVGAHGCTDDGAACIIRVR